MISNLAENIRTFRKQRRLTQEQLAEVMGVTTGAVHKWEIGASVPELGMIMELADFFDVSMDVLTGYRMKDNRIEALKKRLSEYCRTM
nr:helix-turn-helix domain-containing protein [Lachnospiraceae bacterium]